MLRIVLEWIVTVAFLTIINIHGAKANTITGNGAIVATATGSLWKDSENKPLSSFPVGQQFCATYADRNIMMVTLPDGRSFFTKNKPDAFKSDRWNSACKAAPTADDQPLTLIIAEAAVAVLILSLLGLAIWRRHKSGLGWFTAADHWKVWTIAAISAAAIVVVHVVSIFAVATPPQGHTPLELIGYIFAASAILLGWQYFGGKAAGSPERRAALWQLHKMRWNLSQDTGLWHRILKPSLSRGQVIVDTTPRGERSVTENNTFRTRLLASVGAYPMGFSLMVASWMIDAATKSSDSTKFIIVLPVFLMGLALVATTIFNEITYQGGYKMRSFKGLKAGSMVIDPLPEEQEAGDFGAGIPETPIQHPAHDDLVYRPNALPRR